MASPRTVPFVLALAASGACIEGSGDRPDMAPPPEKLLIAHRGASAYAPEHTRAAYELGIEMGADFIEPDLQVTSDGVLISLHDETLERTTNVEEVFPDRFREEDVRGRTLQRWRVSDFTLEEIQSLDAGAWFGAQFVGERVLTFDEVIEIARGRAGIIPETKAPEVYGALGLDMEPRVVQALDAHGLLEPGADPSTPVIIQSFSAESLDVLANEMGVELPLTFLIGGGAEAERWLSPEGLAEIAGFATGIGPSKALLLEYETAVDDAHAAGLTVIPYTFRERSPGDGFESVEAEMTHYLYTLGIDGLFTDNPDHFPRRP